MIEKAMLVLYAIALIIIVVEVSAFWGVAITMMLVLVITLLQKMDTEGKIRDLNQKKERMLDLITERLDIFSSRLREIDQNLNRNAFNIENKIAETRHFVEDENERNYRELAKKIFDIENKLNSVKKTLGAAFGSLDERVKRFEKEEEWTG